LLKIILVQALPVPQFESLENLSRALSLLARCQGQGADLICFPEYFPYSGEEELSQAARQLQAYVVAGLVEEDRGKLYNTATLFDRQGRLVGRQRKCYLSKLERRAFGVTPGDGWQVLPTDFGKIGLPVCIDFWGQPDAARELTAQGADLIVNPVIHPILRGQWLTGALTRAFDNYLPVVGVNTADFVARLAGGHYSMLGGHSFAIQPAATEDKKEQSRLIRSWDDLKPWFLLEGGEGEEILTAYLDLEGPRRLRPRIWERFGIQRG
jgi:predicted amidohydrolase